MEITTILMISFFLIVLYIIYNYLTTSSGMLVSSVKAGNVPSTVDVSKIDSGANASANFAYSIWFNINDWNYQQGSPKPLIQRVSAQGAGYYAPNIYFDNTINNLIVSMNTISTTNETCTVTNIPIQRWTHLVVSVYGKTLDTYINGKLVNTCILNYVPRVGVSSNNVSICPETGFNGWVTKAQYFADSIDPQTAWNLYKAGNGSNGLSDMFGTSGYGVKVSLMNNNVATNEISF